MRRRFFAGYRSIELSDRGTAFRMDVLYPTDEPEKAERIETLELEFARNAALKYGRHPLAVLSHGSGGSPLFYRSLSFHLARNGFIVGLPEHPFDNWRDTSLAGTVENLTNRPRHLRTAVNWFFDGEFSEFLKHETLAVIGHSIGGYTALALAGGVPASQPSETGTPHHIDVEHDNRVGALVLLAPATVWFGAPGTLSRVRVPILLVAGDKDTYTPYQHHARLVLDGVPDRAKVRCGIVRNAGHFSFMSQLPGRKQQAQAASEFDQARFLEELNSEVLEFLSMAFSQA